MTLNEYLGKYISPFAYDVAANGNPDNESVLAARRICEKRGINYNLK